MHSWQKISTSHRGHKTHPRQRHVRNYPPTGHPPPSVSTTHHQHPQTYPLQQYSSAAVEQYVQQCTWYPRSRPSALLYGTGGVPFLYDPPPSHGESELSSHTQPPTTQPPPNQRPTHYSSTVCAARGRARYLALARELHSW